MNRVAFNLEPDVKHNLNLNLNLNHDHIFSNFYQIYIVVILNLLYRHKICSDCNGRGSKFKRDIYGKCLVKYDNASFPILNGSNISFHLYSIKKDNEYEILFTFGELLMML